MKSPLREHHTFNCATYLKEIIPEGSIVNSFLFYGGNLEFQLAAANRFIVGTTNKYVVYEFWHCAFKDPHRIIASSKFFHKKMCPQMAHLMQEGWATYADPFVRAAWFFLLNRYSYDGSPSFGALDLNAYNPLVASRFVGLPELKNFFLNFHHDDDFLVGIDKTKGANFSLFPVGDFNYNLFEHGKNTGFETVTIHHEKLRDRVKKMKDEKCLLLYKPHRGLAKFYKDFNFHYLDDYGRPTDKMENAKEVIIANF